MRARLCTIDYRTRKLDQDEKKTRGEEKEKQKVNQLAKGLKDYLLKTFFLLCNRKVQHSCVK